MRRFIWSCILLASWSLAAFAEENWDDDWGEDWADFSPHSVTQKLGYGFAALNSGSVNRDGAIMNELRYQMDYDYQGDKLSASLTTEVLADAIRDEADIELREASLFWKINPHLDLRVGRQIVTWGTGDFLFLNDTFAKNWQSFFNGREDDYLKEPVDAIRLGFYSDYGNFDLVYQPDFTADKFLNGEAYSFYLPQLQQIVQPEPFAANKTDDSAISFRYYKNFNSIEYAVYFSDDYYTSPSQFLPNGEVGFSARKSLGASLRMPLANGIFNLEVARWNSEQDKNGSDPFIKNGSDLFLIGFEKELVANLTWSIQAYLEVTQDYSQLLASTPAGMPIPDKNRRIVTNRLTYLAMQQTLTHSFFSFYSPSDDDYFIRYKMEYKARDDLELAAGVNWLDGKDDFTFFAQLKDNSNLFIRVTHYF